MPTAELVQPARLNLGGVLYERGKEVPVSFETAHELAANPRFKVSGLDTREALDFKERLGKPRGADLARAINDANDQLDADDDAAFDRTGKPSIEALSRVLGYPVTKEERDSAMNAVEKAPQAGKLNVDEIAAKAAERAPHKAGIVLKKPAPAATGEAEQGIPV